MHFLLEAFIIPFTIVLLLLIVVLLLKNIFPLGGNNNLGTIIVIAAMILFASIVLPFIKQHATSAVIIVSFVAGIIGTAIPYTATGQILQFTALPSEYLILVFALMIFYLLLTSLIKLIYLKHKKFLI